MSTNTEAPAATTTDDTTGSSNIVPGWMLPSSTLSIIVIGASGDLAKKKTYPSLFNLYVDSLLPQNLKIWGYARSPMSDEQLHQQLHPYIAKSITSHRPNASDYIDTFLQQHCYYRNGTSYGDMDAFQQINTAIEQFEQDCETNHKKDNSDATFQHNRLFYFAIPPSAFAETGVAIYKTCLRSNECRGWTRLIVEKPFGRDLSSFEELNATLSQYFDEEKHLFRIDHYLGKEMVQNLILLRFSNIWFSSIWNNTNIQCVFLTFKEPFGTEGRGGYFDQFGIIRDICQNHLLQVLTLIAMETPSVLTGPIAGKAIRDAKVSVLNAIRPLSLQDAVLGQYEGYANDPTITNKDTNTPTFATLCMYVNTPRWDGVPFIMKAGKSLNERKAEIRIQFKTAPAAKYLFQVDNETEIPRNELVLRMQPSEAIYMKTNVKSPGFVTKPIQSELEVNYDVRYFMNHHHDASTSASTQIYTNPDAYTRLILDVLHGNHGSFVRDDELRRAWEIFTPLLHEIESTGVKPIVYPEGSRGPIESDIFIQEKTGYIRNEDYHY